MTTNFTDVGTFHAKFDLDHVECNNSESCPEEGAGPRAPSEELMKFRLNFLMEELQEICHAAGFQLAFELTKYSDDPPIDHEKLFDGLLDLAYVTFGAAHVLGYPWQAGWDEVQRANITKERCGIDHKFVGEVVDRCMYVGDGGQCGRKRKEHSLRGSNHDVIKPEGWTPPNIADVLRQHGFPV